MVKVTQEWHKYSVLFTESQKKRTIDHVDTDRRKLNRAAINNFVDVRGEVAAVFCQLLQGQCHDKESYTTFRSNTYQR